MFFGKIFKVNELKIDKKIRQITNSYAPLAYTAKIAKTNAKYMKNEGQAGW
jgi:hypothetical protein